jgi:hypothetical protein
MYAQLESSDHEVLEKPLLKFSAKRRLWTLITRALSFTMAFAWFNLFSTSTTAMFGTAGGKVASTWLFTIKLTLLLAAADTIPMRFQMFIPKNPAFAFQENSKEREMMAKTWQTAAHVIIGSMWAGAIELTTREYCGKKVTVTILWIAALVVMIVAVGAQCVHTIPIQGARCCSRRCPRDIFAVPTVAGQ